MNNVMSYLIGRTDELLYSKSIPALFQETVSKHGNKNAAIFSNQNIRLTYEELKLEIDRLACGLLSLGLIKGDRVGIWSPNRYECF